MRFSAVVGHDDLKRALLLAAVDPHIGGVLLRGDKGSGKTTLARALADLLPGDAPFVELPLGAGEDRVLGSIDLAAALSSGTEQVRSGLLAAAHGGVLFVDEVNLLADHLVDTLLDVAVSGRHRLERDGISVVQPARFVLVGTMNPEEGELRPQLLDRFGLCVEVSASQDVDERAEIVRRRLSTDAGGVDGATHDQDDVDLRERLRVVRPARLEDEVILHASRLAVEVGAEGLRADLVLCRAAAALAGWEGRTVATIDDVETVAPLVLGHRRRRSPFDPPRFDPGELDEAIDRVRSRDDTDPQGGPGEGEPPASPSDDPGRDGLGNRSRPVVVGDEHRVPSAAPPQVASPRGRLVRDRPHDPDTPLGVDVVATVRTVARRRAITAGVDGDPAVAGSVDLRSTDLRDAERTERPGALTVVCLDVSGSMGARERIELATGTVIGILADAYRRRDRVALVAFGGEGARTVLAPTTSVEVARARLAELSTGGPTPLADGLSHAFDLATRSARPGEALDLVVISDGRATGGAAAFDEAIEVAERIRRAGVGAVVVDTETAEPRLGLAPRLADALGAPVHRPDANPQNLRRPT